MRDGCPLHIVPERDRPDMERRGMPIRREQRGYYPFDSPQFSRAIRFGRVAAACEQGRRPHGQPIHHLCNGRWFDAASSCWRVAVQIAKVFALGSAAERPIHCRRARAVPWRVESLGVGDLAGV